MISIPNDTVPGVRALIAYPSQIRVDLVPAEGVVDFRNWLTRGPVSAAYCQVFIDEAGGLRAYEGETADLRRRYGEHAPFGRVPADVNSFLVFTGPSIDKAMAEGLQWAFCDQLARTGNRVEGKPAAHRPKELVWSMVEYAFAHIRALTKMLGFTIFDNPAGSLPGLHLHREVEERPEAELVWDYVGGYETVAARVNGRLLLLRHSQIRANAVPIARPSYKNLRERLILAKTLVPGPRGTLVTTCDLAFSSLDSVGKFVRGDFSGSRSLWVPRNGSTPTH